MGRDQLPITPISQPTSFNELSDATDTAANFLSMMGNPSDQIDLVKVYEPLLPPKTIHIVFNQVAYIFNKDQGYTRLG